MTQLHATSPSISHRPSPAPWIVAAVAGACAIAAMTTLFVRWRAEPAPVAPAPAAPSVVVAPRPEPIEVAAPVPTPVVAPSAPATGDLVIVTTPRDAIVRIDGQDVTNAEGGSPHVRTNLLVGRHTIEDAREGFASWRTTIDLPPRALELEVELAAEVPPTPPVEPRPRSKRPAGRSGSPDLKDPFGGPRDPEPSGRGTQDLTDPFDH